MKSSLTYCLRLFEMCQFTTHTDRQRSLVNKQNNIYNNNLYAQRELQWIDFVIKEWITCLYLLSDCEHLPIMMVNQLSSKKVRCVTAKTSGNRCGLTQFWFCTLFNQCHSAGRQWQSTPTSQYESHQIIQLEADKLSLFNLCKIISVDRLALD